MCLCISMRTVFMHFFLQGATHQFESKVSHCNECLFLLETQTVEAQCALVGGFTFAAVSVYWFLWRSHRCYRWKISLCTQTWQWGSHADCSIYLFIYSHFPPWPCTLKGLLSPVSPPEVWDNTHLVSDLSWVCTITGCTHKSIRFTMW